MRLVSQNGNIDIPYDKVILLHAQDYVMARVGDKEYVMGEYSSMEKSYKVMEMLRNAYCGLPIIMKNVDISDEVIELLKDLKKNGIIFQKVEENPSVEYVDNAYFKFPADEEVEV